MTAHKTAIVAGMVLSIASGCGGVTLLSIHDGRLPIESRRWIADAEDAVSVANAFLQEAQAYERRTEKLVDELVSQASRISKSGGGQAAGQLEALASTRMKHAKKMVEHAEAELDLAEAKQQLVNAETSMRHDIAVYELDPLREAVEEAREVATKLRRSLLALGLNVHKRSAEYWKTYAGWVRGGGDIKAYWLLEAERAIKKPKPKPKPKETTPAPAPAPAKPAATTPAPAAKPDDKK